MEQVVFSIAGQKPEVTIEGVQQPDGQTAVYVGGKAVYLKRSAKDLALPDTTDNLRHPAPGAGFTGANL